VGNTKENLAFTNIKSRPDRINARIERQCSRRGTAFQAVDDIPTSPLMGDRRPRETDDVDSAIEEATRRQATQFGHGAQIVESKHTEKAIAIAPLAKMRNQLLRRHSGAIGLVFSFSGFTNAAVILARYIALQAILLWTGLEIEQALDDNKILEHLEYKYHTCVETDIPDASIQKLGAPTPPPPVTSEQDGPCEK
jgi:hypothetical protein